MNLALVVPDLNLVFLTNKIRELSISSNLGINRIADSKERIRTWLNEERLSPEEVQNAGAHFTFKINVYGTIMFVVHSTQFIDSFSVSASFDLTGEKDQRILQAMDAKKRFEFLRDLSLALLANNGIWYHLVRPNPPTEMRIFEWLPDEYIMIR